MFSVVDNILITETYRFCNVASFAIAVTDYFLCLPQEIELIWPTRWSTGKVLYIATRYSVFTDSVLLLYLASPNHSVPACQHVFTVSAWLTIVGMIISETVLVFRTWAVWEQNLKLFIILLVILLGGTILGFAFAHTSLSTMEFGTTAEGYPPGCWLVEFVHHPIIILGYIMILCFEIVILVLTLYKCRQAIISKRSKLLITLHRDAILYCFFIAVWSLANIINQVIPSANAPSFEELQRVLHSVLTARILLNLRQAVRASELKMTQSTLSWGAADDNSNANADSSAEQQRNENAVPGRRPSAMSRSGRGSGSGSGSRSRSIRRQQRNVNESRSGGSSSNPVGRYLRAILDFDEENWAHDEESARWLENEDQEQYIEMTALSPARPGSPSQAAPDTLVPLTDVQVV